MKIDRQIEIVKELLEATKELNGEYQDGWNNTIDKAEELLNHLEDQPISKGYVVYRTYASEVKAYLTTQMVTNEDVSRDIRMALIHKEKPNLTQWNNLFIEELK